MESMDKVIDTIMDKKKGYDYDGDDFAAPAEIMVTITLHEYRELVENNIYRRKDVERLREKCEELKKENRELKESFKNKETPADINAILVALKAAEGKKE